MTGQLLARAIVEGRASLNDEASKYLEEPYPNLENGGERVRLLHLANMTSQLADNIPDLTQVRTVPGRAAEQDAHARARRATRARNSCASCTWSSRSVRPASIPRTRTSRSMLLGVVLEKIYGESFETILAREIEKPLSMGSGTAPPTKLLARGYTSDNEEAPAVRREDPVCVRRRCDTAPKTC